MECCLTFIIGFICINYVSGQATQKVCWDSKWYNESGVLGNGSNYEHQSGKVLNTICPDGPVIAAQCKDSKDEVIQAFWNDTVNSYYATCNHVKGLICHPYNNSENATCPEFAIQYGCNCPPATTTGRTHNVSMQGSGTGTTTTKTGTGKDGGPSHENGGSGNTGSKTFGSGAGLSASGQQNFHCGNNGQHYRASHLVLLLSTMTLKVLF
ncbi:uncharacterized protein LOC128550888 [Mercenaria mercenaria]|uniref:uncharacterized protein LOC128550888 n=1 Tax=Mercenaria mercenaria TaxID=6596 RepID=UPI00234F7ED9|nr:uncharacterized protein LOC128550888 [Mercenaria mercenaria]